MTMRRLPYLLPLALLSLAGLLPTPAPAQTTTRTEEELRRLYTGAWFLTVSRASAEARALPAPSVCRLRLAGSVLTEAPATASARPLRTTTKMAPDWSWPDSARDAQEATSTAATKARTPPSLASGRPLRVPTLRCCICVTLDVVSARILALPTSQLPFSVTISARRALLQARV